MKRIIIIIIIIIIYFNIYDFIQTTRKKIMNQSLHIFPVFYPLRTSLMQFLYFTSYYHSIIFELCHILRNLFHCRKKQSI